LKRGKTIALILMIVVIMAFLSGCLRARNVDEYGYVLAIGVDPGESLRYKVTLMLQKLSGGSQSNSPLGFLLLTAECNGLFEAVDVLSATVPYHLNLSRVNMLVVSSEVAQTEKEMEEFLNFSAGSLQIRHSINVLIARGSVAKFMAGLEDEIDPAIAKMQLSVVEYARSTGYMPVRTLSAFYEAVGGQYYDIILPLCGYDQDVSNQKSSQGSQKAQNQEQQSQEQQSQAQKPEENPNIDDRKNLYIMTSDSVGERGYGYLPDQLAREGGLKSSMVGCALFRDGQMVGYLDGQHTQALLMGTGEFRRGRMQMLDPNGEYLSIILLKKANTRVEMEYDGGDSAKAKIKVYLEGEIEMPETVENVTTEQLQQYIAAHIRQEMEKVFSTCRTLGVDAFGLGKHMVEKFPTTEEWENFDWKQVYAQTTGNFEVELRLKHKFTKTVTSEGKM